MLFESLATCWSPRRACLITQPHALFFHGVQFRILPYLLLRGFPQLIESLTTASGRPAPFGHSLSTYLIDQNSVGRQATAPERSYKRYTKSRNTGKMFFQRFNNKLQYKIWPHNLFSEAMTSILDQIITIHQSMCVLPYSVERNEGTSLMRLQERIIHRLFC